MTAINRPRLLNGTQAVQDVQEVSAGVQHYALGTPAWDELGRMYRYAKNATASSLAAAEMHVAQSLVANHQNLDMITAAMAVGGMKIDDVTLGATAATANQYAEGMACIVDGAGAGNMYPIDYHPAIASAGTGDIFLAAPIQVASDADTQVSLLKNKWDDPEQSNVDQADVPVGVPNIAVPAGNTTTQYFWMQTGGPCVCLVDGTPAVGQAMIVSTITVGSLEAQDIVEGAGTLNLEPMVGYMLTVGIDTEEQVVDLKIF